MDAIVSKHPMRAAAAVALVLAVALVHGLLLQPGRDAAPNAVPPPAAVQVRLAAAPRAAEAEPAPAPPVQRPPPARRSPRPAPRPAAAAPSAAAPRPVAPAPEAGVPADARPAPAGWPPPRYATQPPLDRVLLYRAAQGPDRGVARLRWARTDTGYEAALGITLDSGQPLLAWHSRGGLDDHGIAPLAASEQRRTRAARSTEFERAAQRIAFSASAAAAPLAPGAQDRLSWIVQLVSMARADPAQLAAGRSVTLQVAMAGGGADLWTFEVLGTEPEIHLVKPSRRPYDSVWHAWLDPQLGWWPRRLTQSWPPSPLQLELEIAE